MLRKKGTLVFSIFAPDKRSNFTKNKFTSNSDDGSRKIDQHFELLRYNGNIFFFHDIEVDKFARIHGVPNESSEKERSAFSTYERKTQKKTSKTRFCHRKFLFDEMRTAMPGISHNRNSCHCTYCK